MVNRQVLFTQKVNSDISHISGPAQEIQIANFLLVTLSHQSRTTNQMLACTRSAENVDEF